MDTVRATTKPTEPGWYAVWCDSGDKPQVLWWAQLSTAWRTGNRIVKARYWCGPLVAPPPEAFP